MKALTRSDPEWHESVAFQCPCCSRICSKRLGLSMHLAHVHCMDRDAAELVAGLLPRPGTMAARAMKFEREYEQRRGPYDDDDFDLIEDDVDGADEGP